MFDLHGRRTGVVALTVAIGALNAGPAMAKQRASHPAPDLSALAGLSAAEQLAKITEQTGGGHFALINNKRYVVYPDGTRARF